jgi:aminopeptidase N
MSLEHRHHARCACAGALTSRAGGGAASARPFAFPSSPRQFERARPFRVRHLGLDLALDVSKKSVSGVATLRFERVDPEADELVLDAVGFELGAVSLDGAPADHAYDGAAIRVRIPRGRAGGEVAVAYEATPRKGLYFLEPDEFYPDRPRQVWTQCQEEDGRHWFPAHDKPHVKMTTELRVRVPAGWTALSNGTLVASETGEGLDANTYHFKLDVPHPSYLMTLVAGEFARLEAQAGDVPLAYLVPKGREEDGARTFARTPGMIELFGRLTGTPYPYRSYAQVVVSDFFFGGMENTTATTMYEHILLDERAALDITSDDLIAHELAHQWFGDFVTCRDWSEAWLNEGFATYFEHVFREHHLGRDEYEYGIHHDLDSYLGEAGGRYRRPVVCQDWDAPLDLFDRHLYEKGGLVLHMLRRELGDELFFKGVKLYLERHAFGIVETRDLLRALEEVSGRSLGRFFEQWLYKPGHPEVEVALGWERGLLSVHVRQHQSTADGVPSAFELPLVLEIAEAGSDGGADVAVRREKLTVTQRSELFVLPCTVRPKFVVVDPEMRIAGEVKTKAPNDMLRAQLAQAKSARGRWLAAGALAGNDDPVTIRALTERLDDDAEFWGVRAECAAALGKIRARECFEALSRHTNVSHPKVRRAVVGALGQFRTPAAFEALRPLALRDASYLVEAEAARSLGRTRQASALDVLVGLLDRASWADVVRVGATDGLALLRDEAALPHLYARVRYGQPDRARRAAMSALPKITSDRKAREVLEDLLDDPDPLARLDAVRALGELGDPKARGALRGRVERELDARVRRRIREVVRDLGAEAKQTAQALKDELEKLSGEHADLKTRLAKLEARLGDKATADEPAKRTVPSGDGPRTGKARAGAAEARGPRGLRSKASRGRDEGATSASSKAKRGETMALKPSRRK